MSGNNRYRYASELSEFNNMLLDKYNLRGKDGTTGIGLSFDKHIVDRMLDRCVTKVMVSTMITRLVKYHLCELLFLNSLDSSQRIDLWYEGFILGCTVQQIPDKPNVYNIRLRTIFKVRNVDGRSKNYFKIEL